MIKTCMIFIEIQFFIIFESFLKSVLSLIKNAYWFLDFIEYIYSNVTEHNQIIQAIFVIDFLKFNPLFNPYINSYQLGLISTRFHSEWCSYYTFNFCSWHSICVLFLGLKDEGIRILVFSIRMHLSRIRILI